MRMMRRTDPQILIDKLEEQPSNQASPRRLAELLEWDIEKVHKVVTRATADRAFGVQVGRGGVVQYRGRERMSSNGLYADVARVIASYWGPRELRLRNISTMITAQSGRRGSGVWTHPDLVVAADPARRASQDEPRRTHAIEVETADGFDLRSVYQAHAQGRGADYSWVFGNKDPGVDPPDWDRVCWTADELGVGLVTFDRPGAYGTWQTHLTARHNEPDRDERESFLNLVLGDALRMEHDM
jgi:hypothetical protein